jgi:hypothetical protein
VDTPATQLELVRPWRIAAFVVAAIAGVELLLLVVAALVLAGRTFAPQINAAAAAAKPAPKHHAAVPAPAKTEPFRPPRLVATLPRSKTGILILNGNGVQRAAAQAATIVRARGYLVTDTKNAPRSDYPTWRLMAAPDMGGEAKRFAKDLDMPLGRVGPLDGMTPKQLHGARLVLILGVSR